MRIAARFLFSCISQSKSTFSLEKCSSDFSFLSLPTTGQSLSEASFRGLLRPFHLSASTFPIDGHMLGTANKTGIHTSANQTDDAGKDAANSIPPSHDLNTTANAVEVLESSGSKRSMKYTALSNLKTSKRHDLAMVFTCKVCETRSMKTCCRESYEKGVVVVRCGGCNNLHLIADHLGWFGEPGSIEDLLAKRGEEVKKGSVDSLSLTVEDLAGFKPS